MIIRGDSAPRYRNFGTCAIFIGHGCSRPALNVQDEILQSETQRANVGHKMISKTKGKCFCKGIFSHEKVTKLGESKDERIMESSTHRLLFSIGNLLVQESLREFFSIVPRCKNDCTWVRARGNQLIHCTVVREHPPASSSPFRSYSARILVVLLVVRFIVRDDPLRGRVCLSLSLSCARTRATRILVREASPRLAWIH